MSVIAVVLTLIMTFVVLIMQKYPIRKLSMVLVVNSNKVESDKDILEPVKKHCKHYKVRTKNLTSDSLNMIVEVNVDEESKLVHDVLNVEGVTSASILTHDGEITA